MLKLSQRVVEAGKEHLVPHWIARRCFALQRSASQDLSFSFLVRRWRTQPLDSIICISVVGPQTRLCRTQLHTNQRQPITAAHSFIHKPITAAQSVLCHPIIAARSVELNSRCTYYTVSGLASTLWQHLGLSRTKLKHHKYILRHSALRLYLCCVELVDHDSFIKEFGLPDTLNSWFRVTELHVWMCMVRLAQEGKEGVMLRNFMIEFFWEDLDKKMKKLGTMMSSTTRREGIQELSETFKASLFAYDEGLMSDDKVLAGCVWRTLFERNCDDAAHLNTMVTYIRKQVAHLDGMDSGVIQSAGLFTFLPLKESEESAERNRQILLEIAKRV